MSYEKLKAFRENYFSFESTFLVVSVGRWGVVGSTLAFGSTGRGIDSELRYFAHHSASAFSKLRSLASCPLCTTQFVPVVVHSASYQW